MIAGVIMLKTYYTSSPGDRQLVEQSSKECIAWSYAENNSKLIKVIRKDKSDETEQTLLLWLEVTYSSSSQYAEQSLNYAAVLFDHSV